MRYIYNGVDLMPVETYEFNFQSVYDDSGVDYLHTEVSTLIRALVNGQADIVDMVSPNGPFMSYAFSGESSLGPAEPPGSRRPSPWVDSNPPFGDKSAGVDRARVSTLRGIIRTQNLPLLTHETIRHRLSTPRGQFYAFSGPGMESGNPPAGTATAPGGGPNGAQVAICVASPLPGYPVDCRNGPIPKLFNVHTATGDANTLMVDWGCTTYINEAQFNGVNPTGGLLSNRFSQSHSIIDGFTNIQTEGVAIFRSDFIYGDDPATSPDFSRPILFMPIPQGFVREIDYVTGREDGISIRYGYTDKQQSVNFVAGPYVKAAKISAVHRQSVTTHADLIGGALGAYERVLGLKANRNFAKDGGDERDATKAMRQLARMIGREVRRKAPPAGEGGGRP